MLAGVVLAGFLWPADNATVSLAPRILGFVAAVALAVFGFIALLTLNY